MKLEEIKTPEDLREEMRERVYAQKMGAKEANEQYAEEKQEETTSPICKDCGEYYCQCYDPEEMQQELCDSGDCECNTSSGDEAIDAWGNYGVIFYCSYCHREEVWPEGNRHDREAFYQGILGFFRRLFKVDYFDGSVEFDHSNRLV